MKSASGDPARRRLRMLAVAAFTAGATVHYQTPMLGAIGTTFGADAGAVGWIPTLTFGGFLAGTVLLTPLGDRMDKRRILLGQLSVLVLALLIMASAPSLEIAVAASFLIGACASVSQSIVPFTAELSDPSHRGKVMGTLLSALFLGIFFGRMAGGLVAALLGWRWMYVIGALMLVALLPVLVKDLPASPPKSQMAYGALMRSVAALLGAHPALRRIAAIQFLIGIGYGGFWATLAAMMLQLHQLGPAPAGLMAIPGAAGILVARPAGRWMDRSGVTPVVTTGVLLMLLSFAVFGFASLWIGAVIAGAILLDCGVRAALVANQTLANSIVPDARSRANTIFSASVWAGNAAGAFLASTALSLSGWVAVCAIGAAACVLALATQLSARRAG